METVTVVGTSPFEVCKNLVVTVCGYCFREKSLSQSVFIELQKGIERTQHGTSESRVPSCSTSVEDEVRFTNSQRCNINSIECLILKLFPFVLLRPCRKHQQSTTDSGKLVY